MIRRIYIHRKEGYTIAIKSSYTMLDLHRKGIKLSEFIPTATQTKSK